MSDSNDKLKVTGEILALLRNKIQVLTGQVSANNGWIAWGANPIKESVEELFGLNSASDSLDSVLKVSSTAIATLEETKADALVADSAYERWLDLAQSVDDNLSTAMGIANKSLRDLFNASAKAFAENLGSAGEKIKDELAWPTVSVIAILLCVAVIVVFK